MTVRVPITRAVRGFRRRASRTGGRAVAATVVVLAAVTITLTAIVSVAAQPPSPPAPVAPVTTTPAPPTTATPAPSPGVPPSRWVTPPPTTTPVSPTPGVPDSTTPTPGTPGSGAAECGVSDISGCVAKAIDGFFQRLVDSALNPLLDLLSRTLLTTPEPGDLPQVGVLWSQSWQLVTALYVLVVMAAGVLLMVRETLQTRWSIHELLPRLVVGFIAGAMSMVIATTAIGFANALATALGGEGVDSGSAATTLKELTRTNSSGGVFALLLMVALMVMLVVLLVAYVVRVSVTIILIVAAPLFLMCHALPGLEGVARWWWRSFAACLAIQVVQSLTLVTMLRVFLTPGGWGFFGPNANGIVNLIVALALMGVLIKTPFWLLSVLRIGQGRSFVGSVTRSYLTYKTFGLLKGIGSTTSPRPRTPRQTPGPPDPYARVRATRDGQLMLPLEGVRRVKRRPHPAIAAHPPASKTTTPTRRPPRGRQLAFDFTPPDPYRGTRAGRDGQYRLPIPVSRVKPTPPAQPPRPPVRPTTTPRARRPEQLAFDFTPPTPSPPPPPASLVDPYERVRPTRSGQYPLPFPVTRVKATPPPRTPPTLPPPTPPRPVGRQLYLPMPDLPVRRRAPRAPRGGTLR
ncbi:conjugal transfer protein TrbL family protein [Nocardia sp. NPDC005366]|uniref:conjugal transfer protein TrbL family protein n=1 Tax=Nocardia sp. NPDC005366 TaxID=3156878 RepID=UPI0033B76949